MVRVGVGFWVCVVGSGIDRFSKGLKGEGLWGVCFEKRFGGLWLLVVLLFMVVVVVVVMVVVVVCPGG